jgi:putative transposase
MIELVEGLALRRPPPTITHIHRIIVSVATEKGWPSPSYTTIRSIVGGIDPAMLTLAHHDPSRYRDTYELIYRRESAKPNQMWQADHTELDIMIIDRGKAARPWLTVIEDDHSRAIAGYTVFLGAPTALQTSLALRQAVWRKTDPRWQVCGLPDVLYSDHGADFTCRHLQQVCVDTHVELVHSTAGIPRGRGKIERLFGTITTELLPTLPGHIPHHNHGKPVTPPKLSLSQLDSTLCEFILGDYHIRPHSETGQPPAERWAAGGWLPRMPASLDELDLLLLTEAKPRIVHRDGIHCHGLRYLDPTLAAYVGERVTVRYDPRDLAEIRLYYGDEFLCRAVCPELSDTVLSLKDLTTARDRRRRDLGSTIRQRRSLVDALSQETFQPIPQRTPSQPRARVGGAMPARRVETNSSRLHTYFEDLMPDLEPVELDDDDNA